MSVEVPKLHLQWESQPSLCTIIRNTLRETIKSMYVALLMTCGALPVAMIFRLNPYLSNQLYIQHPQETTKSLLLSAGSCYFLLQAMLNFPFMACFIEGRLDLKGKIINTKQAFMKFSVNYCMLILLILVLVNYPIFFTLVSSMVAWETFMKLNLHLLCATQVYFCNSWSISYFGSSIVSQQTIRDKNKVLPDKDICIMKHGVMVKRAANRKGHVYRRVKLSFFLALPMLALSVFMVFVAGATKYILKQSTVLSSLFCFFILILKTILQHWLRKFILKLGAKSSSFFDFITIAGVSVVFDCPVRFIYSQAETSVDFLIVTTGMAIFEVCMRCTSVLQVIKLLKRSPKCDEHSTAKNKHKNALRAQQRILKKAALIMLKVEADMTSEYVAINLSFLLNYLFGHYVGFIVGKKSGIDVTNLISYLIWQYLLEFVVDLLSFALESYHPTIRKIMAENIAPSRLGFLVVNFLVGMYSMLILVLLVVQ